MSSTARIYDALQAGDDDAAVNEIIATMLSTARQSASDHDVMTWRRDNYQDLRRWAGPQVTDYIAAQARVAAGGALALEGQLALDGLYRQQLAADLRFPPNPFVPDPPDPPVIPPE
jgi:hypothetical protein